MPKQKNTIPNQVKVLAAIIVLGLVISVSALSGTTTPAPASVKGVSETTQSNISTQTQSDSKLDIKPLKDRLIDESPENTVELIKVETVETPPTPELVVAPKIEETKQNTSTAPTTTQVAKPAVVAKPVPVKQPVVSAPAPKPAVTTPVVTTPQCTFGYNSELKGCYIEYAGNGKGPSKCKDGMVSHSAGRGTCSGHGGIAN